MSETVVVGLPLAGRCLVQNSPARRVPSHGTDAMASTYAIDFVPVDEPPERFVGFGAPVSAPLGGTVVRVHDGEPDHSARRSQLSLVPSMVGQAGRFRRGAAGDSTEPHVHMQVMDGADPMTARGVPMAFSRFREHRRGTAFLVESGLPAEGSIIEPAD